MTGNGASVRLVQETGCDPMSEQNKDLVRRFVEELDRRGSPPRELVAADFVAHFAGGPPMDFAAYEEQVSGLYAALPGLPKSMT